jgi:hypothetical protein
MEEDSEAAMGEGEGEGFDDQRGIIEVVLRSRDATAS